MRYDLVDAFYPSEPDPAFRRRAAWIAAALAAEASPLRLLDVGCGQGFYFPIYHTLGHTICAIEADPLPRAEAERRAPHFGASVQQARAEALPFAADSFDVVVMSEILEHLPAPARALAEAARVLRPGGLLLISVPHASYPLLWDPVNWTREALRLGPIRDGMFAGIWANHERLYTPETLRAEVAAAGFQISAVARQTRFCLPFLHNLVYGLGRGLLEAGFLPARWRARGLRGAEPQAEAKTSRLNPLAAMIGLVRLIDRANPDEIAAPAAAVNLCLAARKPDRG